MSTIINYSSKSFLFSIFIIFLFLNEAFAVGESVTKNIKGTPATGIDSTQSSKRPILTSGKIDYHNGIHTIPSPDNCSDFTDGGVVSDTSYVRYAQCTIAGQKTRFLGSLYNRLLRRDPTAQGVLNLDITIFKNGGTDVKIVNSTISYERFERQVVSRLKLLKFKQLPAGKLVVPIAFRFTPL